jgi:SAGA-associated factor 29
MTITRANVKLCDEIIAALEGESDQDGSALLGALNILSALRASSEAENNTPQPRGAASAKPGRNAKRKADTASQISADDRESMQAESPVASSPKVLISASSRLKAGSASSRSGSVPAIRETSVKIEEGNDSGMENIKRNISLPVIPFHNIRPFVLNPYL